MSSLTCDPAPRPTQVRYGVLAALCIITLVCYVQRNCIGGVETTLWEELHLDLPDTQLITSVFFLTYALLQVPSGWLAQACGTRRTLPLLAAGWSVALAVMALAEGRPALIGGRLVMGALQAGIFPCATLSLTLWFPATRRGLASGFLNAFMLSGSAVGSQLTAKLLGPLGWRNLFLAYAAPGVLWALWFLRWYRDRPEDHLAVNATERKLIELGRSGPPQERGATPWRILLLSPLLAFINLQQFFKAAANTFFATNYPTYLQVARGLDKYEANRLIGYPLAAGVAGVIIGGVLSDALLRRTGSRVIARKGVAIASMTACAACFLLAFRMPDVRSEVAVASLGAFLAGFSSPCSYAATMEVGGRHVGVVFGFMNMAGNLGAMLFPTVVAWLVVETGSWAAAVTFFAALHLAAAACWLGVNPEKTVA